ncbi:MAG TPA: shikimate kinase, partial [Trueperaceae bacterium]|nr:shikimate kinase [Trueperaceae bacterium]
GGTSVRDENRALLKARGPVVVLTASPETVLKRTRRHRRPLLEQGDPLERIRDLMQRRAAAYDDVAAFKVSTDGRDSVDVVEEIVVKLQQWREENPSVGLDMEDDR